MRKLIIGIVLIIHIIGIQFIFTKTVSAQIYDPTVCAKDNTGGTLSEACAAMIRAFPKPPNAKQIGQDKQTLDRYSFWRVGPNPIALYDTPNGSVVGEIAKGFNYVRATDLSVEGWIKIQGGRWIQKADAKYSDSSFFRGVEITDGLKHSFAWVLDLSQQYYSEVPGGKPSAATKRVMRRYELVTIYAVSVDKDGWRWYMVGPNQWIKQTFVSKAVQAKRPAGVSGYWVAVDLYEQTLIAYQDDTPVFATLIASGLPPNDTKEGLYKVWAKLDRDTMSGATGAPDAYALQSVPWVMYFDGSYSLHGTYWHDLFGYRKSHGCVNLSISDARHVYDWMSSAPANAKGEIENYVYVYGSGSYGSGVLRDK